MPTPSQLDYEALTAPIPGDNPEGGPVPFETREWFEEARKNVDPSDLPEEERATAKKADWAGLVRLTQETLKGTSKDLLVAARLTEALAMQEGFPGLRDGMRLMRQLVEKCWDRLYPPLEDGDYGVREKTFYWLDDAERRPYFPNTIRRLPLVRLSHLKKFKPEEEGQFGWQDWKGTQDGKGKVTADTFQKAVYNTPLADKQLLAEDIDEALGEVNQLSQLLNDKIGPEAPGLSGLRSALEDSRKLIRSILGQTESTSTSTTTTTSSNELTSTNGSQSIAIMPGTTREAAYRQLAQAAAILKQLEPHSPIPYLVERAVELGKLQFHELVKKLIREPNVLSELVREFGLPEEPPPAS
jgi:type VI secretion system protein ImpA